MQLNDDKSSVAAKKAKPQKQAATHQQPPQAAAEVAHKKTDSVTTWVQPTPAKKSDHVQVAAQKSKNLVAKVHNFSVQEQKKAMKQEAKAEESMHSEQQQLMSARKQLEQER